MTESLTEPDAPSKKPLPSLMAGALVFFTAGCVLVLEILGARLLAPFVGVTLRTYTAIIGTALAGISVGTWLGGKAADRVSPRHLLGPLLMLGGASVTLMVPTIRLVGSGENSPGTLRVIMIAAAGLFLPAALLSAVSPTVVKLQLSSLERTGSVVGRLSALATAGSIFGTFITGFVLVGRFRLTHITLATGALLLAVGFVFVLTTSLGRFRQATLTAVVVAVGLSSVGFGLAGAQDELCDRDTPYYCLRVVTDTASASGRTLLLDTLSHSFINVNDPLDLRFWYVQSMATVVDSVEPPGGAISALSIGGGGLTIPRYVAATRPGSFNTVLEVDPAVIEVNERQLGLERSPLLDVRIGDARANVSRVPDSSQQVVVGDAFASESVPWHLTTTEFLAEVRRVVAPGGVFVINVIDYGPLDLARAEIATIKRHFNDVIVLGQRGERDEISGGNVVVAATPGEFDVAGLEEALAKRVPQTVTLHGEPLNKFVSGAQVLTDDFAPVDQLITTHQ